MIPLHMMQDTARAVCRDPEEGATGEIFLGVCGQLLSEGETVELTCVNFEGEEVATSDPFTITYIPEPGFLLLLIPGLIFLALLYWWGDRGKS